MTSQIALPLIPAGARDPASIAIGSGNRAVAEALAAPENWPFRTAILHGPPRSGKSLLARWFAISVTSVCLDCFVKLSIHQNEGRIQGKVE